MTGRRIEKQAQPKGRVTLATHQASTTRALEALLRSDPEALADPYPVWNELRAEASVYPYNGAWILTDYPLVREFLADNGNLYSRSKNRFSGRYMEGIKSFTEEERYAWNQVMDFEYLQVVRADPPDHARLRSVAHRAFTPRAVSDMHTLIADYATELLDTALEERTTASRIDLKPFAYQLPLLAIGGMLGVPREDLSLIHGWMDKIAANKGNATSGEVALEAHDAYLGIQDYVEGLIASHQQSPQSVSDLVAGLIAAGEEEELTERELVSMFSILLFAGHETTTNLIAIGVIDLLEHRAQWELLVQNPDLVKNAIEELLRFVTPVQILQLVAVQERQIEGATIRVDDTVMAVLASANRDPSIFANPDQLDVRRDKPTRHLSFGAGPHFCLGAALARLESEIAFRELINRFPNLDVADEPITWGSGVVLRSPENVFVELN